MPSRVPAPLLLLICVLLLLDTTALLAQAQQPVEEPYEPQLAQPGKDAVWVPTPQATVELMLDVARVSADDYVIDLGSGDGRNVIAAAKRGARALGVEYNADMVALSRRRATDEGVADRATFVEGDMYEADVSNATVLALFLLTENMRKLQPTFLALRPGTRIVSNTFGIPEWAPDEEHRVPDCTSWCAVLLWIVPAQVAGTWRLADGSSLTLVQHNQTFTGVRTTPAGSASVQDGRIRGADIGFTVGTDTYTARVDGDRLHGTRTFTTSSDGGTAPWSATRVTPPLVHRQAHAPR
jgi:SAM-dependent methyltransferase